MGVFILQRDLRPRIGDSSSMSSDKSPATASFANEAIPSKRESVPIFNWPTDLLHCFFTNLLSKVVFVGITNYGWNPMHLSTIVERSGPPSGKSIHPMEIATSIDTALKRACKTGTSPSGDKSEGEELSEGKGD